MPFGPKTLLPSHSGRIRVRVIQPVVEGRGEEEALPVLLRRLRDEARAWAVEISRPIRQNRSVLTSEPGVTKAVQLARHQQACEAILIVFDGDQDCPAELGPKVREWAVAAAGGVPCEVVLPHREYEAWFLATIESLRTHDLIRNDAAPHPFPEQPRGAKAALRERMAGRRQYLETSHQARLSASLSLGDAYRGSRSFKKLTTSFGALLKAMDQDMSAWDPERW